MCVLASEHRIFILCTKMSMIFFTDLECRWDPYFSDVHVHLIYTEIKFSSFFFLTVWLHCVCLSALLNGAKDQCRLSRWFFEPGLCLKLMVCQQQVAVLTFLHVNYMSCTVYRSACWSLYLKHSDSSGKNCHNAVRLSCAVCRSICWCLCAHTASFIYCLCYLVILCVFHRAVEINS